ncbi:MAG: hypothetical protein ACT4P1_02770 [Sporichthyaceae bacterium]
MRARRTDNYLVLDELSPARVAPRVRAGWTLPAALTGLITASMGGWLVYSGIQAKTACDLSSFFADLTENERPATACSGVNLQLNVGGFMFVAGTLLALVALLAAGRRGRAAARAGHPWPLRRILTRAAVALDRRLPGASPTGAPRIGPTTVGALLSVLLLVGVLAAHDAWSAHQSNAELARRSAAQRALDTLVLPAGVTRSSVDDVGCKVDADTVCASSSLPVEELRPAMESLLAGRASTEMCELAPRPNGWPCPVTVQGKIAGYPAIAIVDRHLVMVREGDPPAGAVPLRPGATRGVFFLGTDINVSLLVPFD